MKKQFVDQLNKDEQVNDIFVLHKIDKKNYKNKPGTYLQLVLGDKTGTIILNNTTEYYKSAIVIQSTDNAIKNLILLGINLMSIFL